MSDDLKMYVAMGIFMALPVGIMVLAYISDRFDRDRPTDRPTDRPSTTRPIAIDRPTTDRPIIDRPTATDRPSQPTDDLATATDH